VTFYSVAELLAFNIPRLPVTPRGLHSYCRRELWPHRKVAASGGPQGEKWEYQPPPDVQRFIDELGLSTEVKPPTTVFPAEQRQGRYGSDEPREGYVYIPLYDVHASAGNGATVGHERVADLLAFRADWLRQELNASPRDVALLFVEGRSMEPDLRPGEVIMIDIRDKTAQREAIYVLRVDDAIVVKELQRLPGGRIKVLSKNLGYDSWEFNVTELASADGAPKISIIGRVVWACRRF
jgi:phage repressor protein C with HTH and peptisase S24 domain